MELEKGLIIAYQTAFGNKLPAVYVGSVGRIGKEEHQLWTTRGRQKNASNVHPFDLASYDTKFSVTGEFQPIYNKTHPAKNLVEDEKGRYIISGKDLLAIIQQDVKNETFEFIDNPDLKVRKLSS